MANAYQIHNQSSVYFLTFQVIEWVDVFSRSRYSDIVVDSLNYCISNKYLNVHSWCIMTNHVHTILSANHNNLSSIIRDFKSFTSKKILTSIIEESESRKKWMLEIFKKAGSESKRNNMYQFWTHENHAVELSTNEMIEQRIEYIQMNPVNAGYVVEPWHYKYSCASPEKLINISEV